MAGEIRCNQMLAADSRQVPPSRSRNMAAIRAKNTKPEMTVRRLLHAMGYRFRLHYRALPGRPDLAFPARFKVVEVRGCFWHRHSDPQCQNAVLPVTRRSWWTAKLNANVRRDNCNLRQIKRLGWDALVLWECELADRADVVARLRAFLGEPGKIAPRADKSNAKH
jgi:DNA mismatch endonuclease Vsr